MTKRAVFLAAAFLLSGCSDWLGAPEEDKLAGERITVLSARSVTKADPGLAGLEIRLPAPLPNTDWPQAGGVASHAMPHPELGESLTKLWSADIGTGTGSATRLLAQPVIANGRVHTLDARAELRAFDADNGRLIWQRQLADDDDEGILGGGIAVDGTRIYATTGTGQVIALNTGDGAEIWRVSLTGPIRSAPTIADGRLFTITLRNELFALDTEDGRQLWNYGGLGESLGIVGGAAPAVASGVVIAPLSSGEVAAVRAENGRVVWTESLNPIRRSDSVAAIPQIRGLPVVADGLVIIVGHSNRTIGVDLRTGTRLWEAPVGGLNGAWAAAGFSFIMTADSELVCFRDGLVRWVTSLPGYEDPDDRKDPILWTGPVLAGNRLFVAGSNEELRFYSPTTGEELGRMDLPDAVMITPAVANRTLYLLTERAELIALR